jgi:hypothetical protein
VTDASTSHSLQGGNKTAVEEPGTEHSTSIKSHHIPRHFLLSPLSISEDTASEGKKPGLKSHGSQEQHLGSNGGPPTPSTHPQTLCCAS